MSENGPPAEAADTNASSHADVVALPPVIYLAGLISGLVAQWALGGSMVPESTLRLAVGAVAVALGLVGLRRFASSFASSGQDRNPRTPTPSVISDGLFARSRNPAYVSLTTMLFFLRCQYLLRLPSACSMMMRLAGVMPSWPGQTTSPAKMLPDIDRIRHRAPSPLRHRRRRALRCCRRPWFRSRRST